MRAAIPSYRYLLSLAFVVVTASLGGCNGQDAPSERNEPQADSVSKTYVETYKYGGLPVQVSGDAELASRIKANNDHALSTLSSHQDNYLFSPYEEAYSLAMLAAGTGSGPVQDVQNTGGVKVLLDKNGEPVIDANGNVVVVPVMTTAPVTSNPGEAATYIPGEGDQPLHTTMYRWNQQLQQLIDPSIWHRNTGLWGHEHYLFLNSYLDTLAQYYGPEISALSFMSDATGSANIIGDWLGAASNGTLTPLMTFNGIQIGERTRVVILNTETLKAEWPGVFDAASTTDERFKMLDGTMKLVPTMHATGTFDTVETAQYQAFQLPFTNSTLALLVIMPKEGEFENVQNQIGSSPLLKEILGTLHPADTTLHLPRFSIETAGDLIPPSGSESYISFYDVNGQGHLYLKQKAHMATIDLSESGINAHAGGKSILEATVDEPISVWGPSYALPSDWYSASASFTMGNPSHPCYYPPQSRPFMFVIRETTTSTILYAGTWTTPDGPEMEADWMASGWQSCEEALNPPPEIVY